VRILIAIAALALPGAPVLGLDHSNLDEGRPLRLEDPYPIAHREIALEFGVGRLSPRTGRDRSSGTIEILYGLAPNLQVGASVAGFSPPGDVEGEGKSGDLHVDALYNFNQESFRAPALGIQATIDLPTGADSAGLDGEIRGMVTRGFGRLQLHLNAAREFLSGTPAGVRRGRWIGVLGGSYPLGAPRHTRTLLVGDIFSEDGALRGEDRTVGGELGVRVQAGSRVILDAALGREFSGPADRASATFTAGISVSF
jgi:hypothetical protein